MRTFSGGLLFLLVILLLGCTNGTPEGVDARDLDPFAPGAFEDIGVRELDPFASGEFSEWETADPQAGRAMFERPVLADKGGCITCHSLDEGITLVGPSLYGIADTARTRQIDTPPPDYLYLSITQPNLYIVDGFAAGVMPDHYSADLTHVEIIDLVSFLMTLQNEAGIADETTAPKSFPIFACDPVSGVCSWSP